MTAFAWNTKSNLWEKECCICKHVYTVSADKSYQAQEAFSPFFASAGPNGDGLQAYCRTCFVMTRNGRKTNGLSKQEMFEAQKGKCALNGEPITLERVHGAYIDHDHVTGKIRALLCPRCNMLMCGVDNDEWLAKAIDYRDTHRNT